MHAPIDPPARSAPGLARPIRQDATGPARAGGRHRVVLGVAAATGLAALVMLGILPISIVVYGAMVGAMLAMHQGGHGMHGGHAAPVGHDLHVAEEQDGAPEGGWPPARPDRDDSGAGASFTPPHGHSSAAGGRQRCH